MERWLIPPHLPAEFREQAEPGAPAVTIITAVLNGAATIVRTLRSVAEQTAREELEHLVIDGGSTDGTIGLAARAAHRPRLVVEPDHGIYDAFNGGLARARGEWIAFLNADDVYAHPRVVETVLAAARRVPEVDVFHADQVWVDADDAVVRSGRFVHRHARGGPAARADYAQFDHKLPLFHLTTFCRRRVFARVGGFDPSYRIAGDYDLLLRAWLAGASFHHLEDIFVRMRTGGLSERARLTSDVEVVRAWYRRSGGSAVAAASRLARIGLVHLLERRAPAAISLVRRGLRSAAPHEAWGLQDVPVER